MSVKIDRTGYRFTTNEGYEAIVIQYKNNKEIIIEFQDEHKAQVKTAWHYIIKGNIRNPFHKTVYGVGCLGVMKNGERPKTCENSKELREYTCWHSMLHRCYSESSLRDRPSYEDAQVCSRWLVYSNFLEDLPLIEGYDYWINNPNKKIALDKDIKGKNSKIYSLENCCFIDIGENSKERMDRVGNPNPRKE